MKLPLQQMKKGTGISAVFLFAGIIFGLLFFGVHGVSAQGASTNDVFGVQPFQSATVLSGQDIRVIIAKIIRAALGLLGAITVSIMIYAGYLWMTSRGEEDKIEEARKIIVNATIGLAIILSALTIVQFILNALAGATGFGNPTVSGGTPPPFDSFAGSGGLGHIVQDHYPFRDQKEVARNTKVVVTFREYISPASIIKNAQPVGTKFGVCRVDAQFSWADDCDRLNTSTIKIYRADDPSKHAVAAAVAIAYEGADARTFVFRPLDLLGSDTADVEYIAEITGNVQKKDGSPAFTSRYPAPYIWHFWTSTALDATPPHVIETSPRTGSQSYRNTITQITFDEPIDPSLVQGALDGTGSFINVIFGVPTGVAPRGQWTVSNGYRTVEFVSSDVCGQNSCGDPMYCLPVSPSCTDASCLTDYRVLVRTAATVAPTSWESIPFTGVADLAGNALDSGTLGTRQGKPTVGDGKVISAGEENPDNFLLPFKLRNEIDFSIPYVGGITPKVDAEDMKGSVPLAVTFSKVMWYQTLETIDLEEYGTVPAGKTLDPIWNVKRYQSVTTTAGVDVTKASLLHREFGPNDLDLYYFTSIPSTVKGNNQNCLYPGRGPATGDACQYSVQPDGTVVQSGCLPVDAQDASKDTGCAHEGSNTLFGTVAQCLTELRQVSTPPTPTP